MHGCVYHFGCQKLAAVQISMNVDLGFPVCVEGGIENGFLIRGDEEEGFVRVQSREESELGVRWLTIVGTFV